MENSGYCHMCLKKSPFIINLQSFGGYQEVTLERMFSVLKFPDDFKLPGLLCELCSGQLRKVYEFYHQTLESANKLQKFLETSENKLSENSTNFETKEVMYPCDSCDLNYHNEHEMQRHQKLVHVNKSSYYHCEICGSTFKTRRGLQQHLSYCHNVDNELIRCDLCLREFPTKTSHTNHVKHHHEFICKFCDHGWISEKRLLEHVKSVHKDRLFQCKRCTRTERLKKMLNRHFKMAHGEIENGFYCGHCSNELIFKDLSTLNEHIYEKHRQLEESNRAYDELLNDSLFAKDIGLELEADDNHVMSDENQDFFLKQFNLVRVTTNAAPPHKHNRNVVNPNKMILEEFLDEAFENDQIWTKYIEGGEEYLIDNYEFYLDGPVVKKTYLYKCPRCEEGFNKQQHLTTHLAETHKISCLICNDCGANFNKTVEYRRHRQEHLKENIRFRENMIPEAEEALALVRQEEKDYSIRERGNNYVFTCKLCDRTFLKKCNLEKHQCSFDANKPQDEICEGSSSNTNSHASHNSTLHESLFCTLCDKKFTSISGLKYHLKRHTDIKAFPCLYCSKKFTASSNLNAHIRNVHSEQRSHVCSECDGRFASKDHLTKHVRSKHRSERAFGCPKCPKRYFQKSHLNDHVAAAHAAYRGFNCNLCNTSYSCRGSLRRHMAKSHSQP